MCGADLLFHLAAALLSPPIGGASHLVEKGWVDEALDEAWRCLLGGTPYLLVSGRHMGFNVMCYWLVVRILFGMAWRHLPSFNGCAMEL